jgi:TPP-dependent pyruvate/acetoin dehydrogenase alpha subunit
MKYSKELLKSIYLSMLRIRLCEESFVEPIIKGMIRCPVHLYTGEEAIAAGMGAALQKRDYVFGNHRSHGHYLAKGGGMRELVAEVYCRETGCSRGRGGSMHLIDPQIGMLGSAPIVGGTISLALGSALASSIREDGRVSVSFFGDGATGEGVLCESLNFAALRKLPIIFACENNFYSTHMPIDEIRISRRIFEIAEPFGVKTFQVDGNDALAVYQAAQKAVMMCRKGRGPVFIEFLTYRMRGHVGPDDNIQGTRTDIRPPKEVAQWRKKDPILRLERYLRSQKLFSSTELQTIKASCIQEVQDAHEYAKASPYPKEEELPNYVFK